MARKSARLLGQRMGKSPQEVNLMLEKIGFIKKGNAVSMQGKPTWELTELGKKHGEPSGHQYSYGFVWDDEVVSILKQIFKI